MLFRPDNFADVFGLFLGITLLLMSHRFRMKMRKSGASAWEEVGGNLLIASAFFTGGMLLTLSTILFSDALHRELLNLMGNILWVAAAYFAYKMLSSLVKTVGVMMGV